MHRTTRSVKSKSGNFKMFDWVPVAFVVFKAAIFIPCMFFAIKWHYDQGKKKGVDSRTLLKNSAKVVLAFIVGAALVLYLTFTLAKHLGMDLTL